MSPVHDPAAAVCPCWGFRGGAKSEARLDEFEVEEVVGVERAYAERLSDEELVDKIVEKALKSLGRHASVAAGRSAEEKRWVALAEMAGELCAMSGNDECEADVVDGATGAINFLKLLSNNEPELGIC